MFLAFENDMVAMDFDHLLGFDEAGEAAGIRVAQEGTRIDYKVT